MLFKRFILIFFTFCFLKKLLSSGKWYWKTISDARNLDKHTLTSGKVTLNMVFKCIFSCRRRWRSWSRPRRRLKPSWTRWIFQSGKKWHSSKGQSWHWGASFISCQTHENSFSLSFARSIYKKAGVGKEKQDVTYIVAKKGVGSRVRRPAGVKGAFRVVDGRMKKDTRAAQRKDERQRGKGGRGNKGGRSNKGGQGNKGGWGNKGGRGMKAGKGRPKKWATPLMPSFRLS